MAMEEFNKKKNELEVQKAEAEASFDGEKVGELEKALADLEVTRSQYEHIADAAEQGPTDNQINQITNLGGDVTALNQKLEESNQKVEETEKVVEEVQQNIPNDDIKHKVNVELESGSTNEEVVQNPNFKEQDAKKLEEFKDTIIQKMNVALEEFKTSRDVSVLNKFQKSLDGQLHQNLDTPQGHFLKEIDTQVEAMKKTSLEKPKKLEDIPAYLDALKQRFDQIPGEYEAAVSNLLQSIQTEEEKDVINRILGINETNTKKEEIDSTRESILNKYKDVNKEYIGNGDIDDTFQFIVEKHPDSKISYDAMQALRSEKNQLKLEKNQYDEALQLVQNPDALKDYFDFTGSNGMIRSRAQYRLEVAKKLIDIGVLKEEKVAQDFEAWVDKTKREDLGKWKPEDQEKEMELFRDVYRKTIQK